MSVRFRRLADGGVFDSEMLEPNLNILAHAQAIELDIGSQCGGHGVCGKDRVRIAAADAGAFSPVTEAERDHLGAAELAAGWRLACQCFPNVRGTSTEIGV